MVLFTGVTVEEAIEKGLTELGLSRSQAQITILAKESKGFFGFGKKLAQVELNPIGPIVELPIEVDDVEDLKVTRISDESTQAEEVLVQVEDLTLEAVEVAKVTEEAIPVASEPIEVDSEPTVEATSEKEDDSTVLEPISQDDFANFVSKEFIEPRHTIEEASAEVCTYIEKIIYEMDLEATLSTHLSRRHMTLQIETPEPGRIIGYHGKVLKSLQLLAQNFLHDRYSRHFSVALNVRDYLENRTETLIDMATKAAHRVLDTGKPYRLDPMTNQERKTIHKTVSRISGVESYSEGDDPNRYVIIVPRD